jgi:predicted CXXCH cytochrome family protein
MARILQFVPRAASTRDVRTNGADECTECHGKRGGVKGNEVVVNGRVLCDYCHADVLRAPPARKV